MDRAWVDEIDDFIKEGVLVSERLPAEGVTIPPYGQDHQNTRPGDKIVVLTGDQFAWQGRVRWVESSLGRSGLRRVIHAVMTRLDGSFAGVVQHRAEAVGRILKEVPRFEHPEDADAWLTGQLLSPVQEWATGARVVFSSPPHLAVRLALRHGIEDGRTERAWLEHHDDMEAEGRVTKFLPEWQHSDLKESAFGLGRPNVPGYELLVTLDGEPDLIEVAARRIKRLA